MKQSFTLVLSFSLVLASAVPADWSAWNKNLDNNGNDKVYSKVGEIFEDVGNFGDIKLMRMNGLAIPFPDELVQFLKDDSFPSMNWNTFPDFETSNLAGWGRESPVDTIDPIAPIAPIADEDNDVFLPKWTTEWGQFEASKSFNSPLPDSPEMNQDQSESGSDSQSETVSETGSDSQSESVSETGSDSQSESVSQTGSEEMSHTEEQETSETQNVETVEENNYQVEEDESTIWFFDTTLKGIQSYSQQVLTDAATSFAMPLEFPLEGAIIRPRIMTCLDKRQNRIEDECLSVALSWMNLQFGKNYMECLKTSEGLKNKIYELTGQIPNIDEGCRAIQMKEMRVLYSDCIISNSEVKNDKSGEIDLEMWKKETIESSTLSETEKLNSRASFDTCMASEVVLPYSMYRWNVWTENTLPASMKAFVNMTDNLLRLGHLKPSKSMITVDCMRSAMLENGCANMLSHDYLTKLISGWTALNLKV